MNIEQLLQESTVIAIKELYNTDVNTESVQIQQTRKEFEGDKTIVVFPFLKFSRKNPEQTAQEIGEYLTSNVPSVAKFNIIKGFLNLTLKEDLWVDVVNTALTNKSYGFSPVDDNSPTVMIEYSSPNTNKPLHLGHIRNNLVGYSLSQLLAADGKKVVKVNLVNDRGIHICKSMVAWLQFGEGKTPESTGIKGDHLVGDYYVKFDQEYKKQVAELIATGKSEDEAKAEAPILLEARDMLLKWESGDVETVELWKTMNGWVYDGFDKTYERMGVSFDKIYYESETYLLGKKIVLEGLEKEILFQKEDSSIWADLTDEGLDQKLLLRPDGTSVYMTQDIGTAIERFEEYGNMQELIYVVGNEQNYHFDVLKRILKKLGYNWSDKIYHMSYGMVELPEGKMKSREGTVVDADDLMEEMVQNAAQISKELGKLEGYSEEEANKVFETIALGALKYFILKVEPRKTMTFNPKESIDFNGNTGPFIQYTYARINSMLRKAVDAGIQLQETLQEDAEFNEKETSLVKLIAKYPGVIKDAAKDHSPSMVANFVYELVKEFNQFYHDYPILKEKDTQLVNQRLLLSSVVAKIIKSGMGILGINVPERM